MLECRYRVPDELLGTFPLRREDHVPHFPILSGLAAAAVELFEVTD
jgi:hypothetical protein